MKSKSKLFFEFIRRNKFWSIVITLAVIMIAWYFIKNSSENVKYTEVAVERGSISEIVSVTGNVKPLESVDLAFELGGRVASIPVAVGDKVSAGQALLSVDNSDLIASVNQAKANLKRAQAQLDELNKGIRPEQLTLENTKVSQATSNLTQAKSSLVSILNDSYTKADDAVRNKVDMMFNNPRTVNAQLIFQADSQLLNDIESGRVTIEGNLISWNTLLKTLNASSDFNLYSQTAKKNLDLAKTLLENMALAVNNLTASTNISQTSIDTWKLNVSSARTEVSTAINTLLASVDQYNGSISALKLAKDELQLQSAPATTEQLAAQEASVEQVAAQVASAETQLAKTTIKSPINGVVININTKLGEIIPAGKNVVSVISYGDYEVEAFVPEADISKVKIGNSASTTLDAYGNGVDFQTTVIKIDPAATVIDGVPTYKVTLKFAKRDDRIKSGMTANLDILTNHKDNTLIIPSRVIITKDDGKYVTTMSVMGENKTIEKKIITGLRGADGKIEVVSGINIGDSLVIPSSTN